MPLHALSVDLAERSYPVLVGPGARHEVARFLPPGAKSAAVVTQQAIKDAGWVDGLDLGLPAELFVIPDGEDAKRLSTVETLARHFARAGLSRADVVIAVGGGIVTDVAGFAAASYHRGTAYVNVATSLLGQVDAAIGGKTGVNLPEGKNLVGAFWQPAAVLCDTETLTTLSPREMACGRGEIAKYAFLGRGADGSTSPSTSRWPAASPSRRRSWRTTSVRGRAAWSSTTATRSPTHSRVPPWPTTTPGICATARPSPSASCSLPSWRSGSVASTPDASRSTGGSSPASTCPPTSRPTPMRSSSSSSWPATRRHSTTSRSCSTVPAASSRSAAWRVTMSSLPWRAWEHAGEQPMTTVLLLSGPNLNLLGEREPDIYGTATLDDHVKRAEAAAATHNLELEHFQSNHEGDLIESIHGARGRFEALVVNAGALTHTSWSLHDALAAFDGVVVELHLSNPAAREPFRHTSVVAPVADGSIAGFGGLGYELAVDAVAALLKGADQ